mmetsp:Transcript_26989/g.67980  ORF Transcript_26989/g.67980 Transcript_26989/m.67980 type:complete len:251 (-) Transcript_26989:491-1243(-)|eukprot:CAMPEP_0178982902 /NCGR_PEP_ID=MMETSP0795-20121207/754_1 /TAXON_ID=88552 /ORGANISM="Amoebophrya sp., Strain Ameob2" /LENGTH=250 /DNA_ID=CAMNT_0020673599 /DNA_START=286 /DNA_END=1038 /DNA_ORIENTATION=-
MGRFILAIAASGQTLEVAGAKWNNKAGGSEVDKPQSKGFLGITDEPEADALTLTPDGDVLGGQGGLNATTAAFLEAEEGQANGNSEAASVPMAASVPEENAQSGMMAAAYTKQCTIAMSEELCTKEKGAMLKAETQQRKAGKHLLFFQKVDPFLKPLDEFYEDQWKGEGSEDGQARRDAAKCAYEFLGEPTAAKVGGLLKRIHDEMEAVKSRGFWALHGHIQEYLRKKRLVSDAKNLLGPICEQLKAASN